MPRSLADLLRADGLDVQDVRDVGLRGDSDLKVLAYATQHAMALITRDRELGNIPPIHWAATPVSSSSATPTT